MQPSFRRPNPTDECKSIECFGVYPHLEPHLVKLISCLNLLRYSSFFFLRAATSYAPVCQEVTGRHARRWEKCVRRQRHKKIGMTRAQDDNHRHVLVHERVGFFKTQDLSVVVLCEKEPSNFYAMLCARSSVYFF